MMHPSVSVPPAVEKAIQKPSRRDSALLLLLAWFIPLGIHLIPWDGAKPLGASMLPAFWAALVAAYLYGTGVGLLVGLSAPLLNFLVLGFPPSHAVFLLAAETVVFVLVLQPLLRRFPRFWWSAAFGYMMAKVASTGLEVAPAFPHLEAAGALLLQSLRMAWPGWLMLTVINAVLVKAFPPPDDWDAT